jgi:hypothetical protein
MSERKKSKGHLFFKDGCEYMKGEKYIFKADVNDPIECTGRRECAKFICTIEEWNKTVSGYFPLEMR